jgi:hypothetical protein
MPANTDIYGFTYPCPGEAVSPATIATLAGQIDTKMADVNTDWFEMLNRRNASIQGVTQNIPNGVETVLATPSYTFPVAGVYLVSIEAFSGTTPATINMFRVRPRFNAATLFGVTMNTENFILTGGRPTVPMIAAAGDTATVAILYNGTGTMDVSARMAVKMLCRIA